MHHVIVGSGPAGVVAAETLKTHQKDVKVERNALRNIGLLRSTDFTSHS